MSKYQIKIHFLMRNKYFCFFFSCPSEQNREKVQFFLNEQIIEFDFCNIGLCDFSKVLQEYKHFLNADCQNIFCGGNFATKVNLSYLILIFSLMRIFLL
jgi:multiple inositol-polyphosphate phosphatase / 2,3-bisphosphoglycerate 3-phosphatase